MGCGPYREGHDDAHYVTTLLAVAHDRVVDDPLLDEGKKYADTLEHAGVEVEYTCYMGMIHGFMRMGAKVDKAITALDDAAQALRIALA